MRDIVIDTDAASLLQKNQAPPWVLRHVDGARIWLTFVTVGELAKWAVIAVGVDDVVAVIGVPPGSG